MTIMTEYFFSNVITYGWSYASPGCTGSSLNCAGGTFIDGPCNTSGFPGGYASMEWTFVYGSWYWDHPTNIRCIWESCGQRLTSGFFADVASAEAWAIATYGKPAGFGSCVNAHT